MGSKMLIDATHREETRVVVVRGQRIEEFDYESAQRKQLKGNIYLAKVTRVEPSLQAAFVDYGGNRHGFLAFSEIHPDYYQIPVADRQALLREEREDAARSEEDFEAAAPTGEQTGEDSSEAAAAGSEGEEATSQDRDNGGERLENVEEDVETRQVDSVGAEDALEELPRRGPQRRRTYKIQEVIKRRQVMLVQVVKEERGTKGAALTTYLSLAGRYCVLMPNTARGGGISRKITDAGDRRRLKDVTRDIEVPEGMGLIVRTAGAQRTKSEIKRDYDYLMRLWENVRDLTLKSTAPALVYEEGNLIKRAIRDLYTKDVEEVLVEGDEGYREAKEFMKMLMPSHARNVKPYKGARTVFAGFQIESQLDALFSPTVTLPSGGYLVLNQTEALVSIDINSGKATREHSIEDTALKTNLEAAEEIARQLRLRDLAGLIVIDFIDMEEKRNNRSVERRLKDALKHDRARIQVGRISHFGLLEMSRQRLRPGMLEGSTRPCPHCEGTGLIRSISSCALSVLRDIEENLTRRKAESLTVRCHPDVAFYILNDKREHLLGLENNFGVSIYVQADASLKSADSQIDRDAGRLLTRRIEQLAAQTAGDVPEEEGEEEPAEEAETEEEGEAEAVGGAAEERPREEGRRRRRRRRGRRGGRGAGEEGQERPAPTATPVSAEAEPRQVGEEPGEPAAAETAVEAQAPARPPAEETAVEAVEPVRPRRARKKAADAPPAQAEAAAGEDGAATAGEAPPEAPPAKAPAAKRRTSSRTRAAGTRSKAKAGAESQEEPEPTPAEAVIEAAPPPAPPSAPAPAAAPAQAAPQTQPSRWTPPKPTAEPAASRKSGWWAKRPPADPR